uniref:Uncharacterized protein n=1 Tax=Rhizophora mucronata TaxID=61149 RepID=A0A2P2PTT8_RHIMU
MKQAFICHLDSILSLCQDFMFPSGSLTTGCYNDIMRPLYFGCTLKKRKKENWPFSN